MSSMEVTDAVRQPYGLLHGGASLAMGETTASFLSGWEVMKEGEIGCGHFSGGTASPALRGGLVICRAVLERKEKNRHECRMEIRDGRGRLICTLHMINAVLERKRDVGSEEQ